MYELVIAEALLREGDLTRGNTERLGSREKQELCNMPYSDWLHSFLS